MNSLAEHPKVVANHAVLSENVKHHAPFRVLLNHIRSNHQFVPQNPSDAVESERHKQMRVNSDPCAF